MTSCKSQHDSILAPISRTAIDEFDPVDQPKASCISSVPASEQKWERLRRPLASLFALLPRYRRLSRRSLPGRRMPRTSAMSIPPAAGRARPFQVTVGGQFSQRQPSRISPAAASRPKIVDYTKPLTPKQVNELREKMQELQKEPEGRRNRQGNGRNPREARHLQYRRPTTRRSPRPSRSRSRSLADAEPGQRELRLANAAGLVESARLSASANCPKFARRPESADANQPPSAASREPGTDRPASPRKMAVTLPAAMNGRISPLGLAAAGRQRADSCPAAWIAIGSRPARASSWSSSSVPGN